MTMFLTLPLVFVLAAGVTAVDLLGVWTLSWRPDFGGNDDAYDCSFKQTGPALTVTCRNDPSPTMTGEIKESNWLPAPNGPFYLTPRNFAPDPGLAKALQHPHTFEGPRAVMPVAGPEGAAGACEREKGVEHLLRK